MDQNESRSRNFSVRSKKKYGSGLCVAISHFSPAFLLLEEEKRKKKNDKPTNFYFLFLLPTKAKKKGGSQR